MRVHGGKRRIAIASLATVLILVLSVGGTLAYFTYDDHACTTYRMTAVGMSLDETWNPHAGIGVRPGDTMVKEPLFTNTEDESYLLVKMYVVDGDATTGGGGTGTVTDPRRLALILGTLYYDPQGSIATGGSYTSAELASLPGVQRVFNATMFEDATVAGASAGTRIYESLGILAKGQTATLFSKVAIPSDYSEEDMKLMGDYTVSLQGTAIQAKGFASRTEAFDVLRNM